MIVRRPNLGLPRRVVTYHLLFCSIAIVWLVVGFLIVAHGVFSARSITACLSRLGKVTAAVELEYLRHAEHSIHSLLVRAKNESHFRYCALEGLDGTYLVHTDASLVGSKVEEHAGTELRWASISGTRYLDQEGNPIHEYRVPLSVGDRIIGALRVGVPEPSLFATVVDIGRVAPLVLLIPLGLVVCGALVLSRLTNSLSEIGRQLHQLATQPIGEPVQLQALELKDATSLGWNRAVAALERNTNGELRQSVQERLQNAVAERRVTQHAEILRSLPDGVALTDVEGRLTFVNRAVAALLGEELSEGADLASYLGNAGLEAIVNPEGTSTGAPVIGELQRPGKQSDRFIRVARSPVQLAHGAGQLWCLRDVTQQKLSDQMRDQFIDTATHELRTPLANIKAYAETLVTCETIDVEEQKEFCNIINSEVTRLARFVDDLLSISSIEMGALCIDRQRVDTFRMFTEVLDKIEPLMQQKQIAFTSELPEKLPELQLDKDKFVVVLVNLLGNAAKYTPAGGQVTFRVTIENSHLQCAVIDSGIGIEREELPKLFDKVFRSADPRVQEETGTGLGLSLAQEVVRMHRGVLTVESELNVGSTFTVTLPIEGAK